MQARAAQKALLEEGAHVRIEAHGVDVGTDVTAGPSRNAEMLKQRSDAAAKRAHRVSDLTELDRTSSKLTELDRT